MIPLSLPITQLKKRVSKRASREHSMFSMAKYFAGSVRQVWSSTSYAGEDVSLYADDLMLHEARIGLKALSFILFCLFGVEALLLWHFGFSTEAAYTCGLLSLLAVHILISTYAARDTRSIYVLGTTLLMVSGAAFVLLADKTGSFNLVLFSSVVLLFMVVPIVPWGLREALMVLALIYIIFTVSTSLSTQGFEKEALWSLQFIMLGAGIISLTLVARNTRVRKNDIKARFDLEQMNRQVLRLSNKDPLTEAWNRRYLKNIFQEVTSLWHARGESYHFAFIDIDDFKQINDRYGHEAGDRTLRCVSKVFHNLMSENGHLVRMGGDEFALLFSGNPDLLMRRGLQHLDQTLSQHALPKRLRLRLSIGMVSIPPGSPATQESVYRRADAALYQAKRRKESFSEQMNMVRDTPDGADLKDDSKPATTSERGS